MADSAKCPWLGNAPRNAVASIGLLFAINDRGTMGFNRFDVFFERHIGIGIRWDDWAYPLHLSISIPFITLTIGFGKEYE